MLPGVGGLEYVVIAMLALVVIGPKDLPMLMRKAGAAINRLRGMAAEFRASFDEMARQSELDELRKQVEELRSGQLAQPLIDEIAPAMTQIDRDVRASLSEDWTGTGAAATPVAAPEAPAPKSRPRKAKAAKGAKAPTKAAPKAPAKSAPRKAPAVKVAAKPVAKPVTKPAAKVPAKPKPAAAKPKPAPKIKPAAKPRAKGGSA